MNGYVIISVESKNEFFNIRVFDSTIKAQKAYITSRNKSVTVRT